MLLIESYSKEKLEIKVESISDIEVVKEWIKEELVGIKPEYEILNIIEEILRMKIGEKNVVYNGERVLLTIEKTA